MDNNFPKEICAALIDMDGVLYDSMPFHAPLALNDGGTGHLHIPR